MRKTNSITLLVEDFSLTGRHILWSYVCGTMAEQSDIRNVGEQRVSEEEHHGGLYQNPPVGHGLTHNSCKSILNNFIKKRVAFVAIMACTHVREYFLCFSQLRCSAIWRCRQPHNRRREEVLVRNLCVRLKKRISNPSSWNRWCSRIYAKSSRA